MASKGKAEKTIKLNRQAKTLLLDTFELTDSASRNILISNVKSMFEKETSRNQKAASELIKLIQENKMDQQRKWLKKTTLQYTSGKHQSTLL